MRRRKTARVPVGSPAERFARVMAKIIRDYDLDEAVLAEALAVAMRLTK